MGKKDDEFIYIDGCPDWMLTLGDCMSLLVTFFVLLLSFSTPNSDKLQDALEGMKGALSVMQLGDTPSQAHKVKKSKRQSSVKVDTYKEEGGKSDSRVNENQLAVVNLSSVQVANRFNEFKERILELGFHKFVRTKQLDQGISIEIPFSSLFAEGKTKLKKNSYKFLESFANLSSSINNEIQIIAVFHINDSISDELYEWTIPRKRVLDIGETFIKKYNIHKRRFTYGYIVTDEGRKPYVRLLLAEKVGISKVTIDQLLSFQQDL